MARTPRKNDSLSIKHLNPINLQFSMFTKDELKKLCVMKIHTPLTLDQLGHPLPGGLYDKNLGPLSERSEPCGTCRKAYINCPGHLGYIELPLPVVNPIFHPIIGIILRSTCLSCYHIQIPSYMKYLFCIQIRLLNCGLITETLTVQRRMSELISIYQDLEKIPEDEIESILEYEILAKRKLKELNNKYNLNKNTEDLRNQILSDLLQTTRKLRTVCMYCKKTLDRIKVLRNKVILTKKHETSGGSSRMRSINSQFINPEQSRNYMQNIWNVENDLIKHIVSVLTNLEIDNPTDIFYCDIIPVIPPNCRPANIVNKRITEHPQVQQYKNIIQQTILLKLIIQVVNNKGNLERLPLEAKSAYKLAYGNTPIEKLNSAWEYLQTTIDGLLDRLRSNNNKNNDGYGLKQIIEKKSGIMRMHMMGKRVNYSARSVITPDPNLNIDEIGIPEAFAKHLTYPVPVTVWNVQELRKMIMNGPDVHPGAVMVEYEDGTIKRINTSNQTQQESILKRLLTPDDKENGFKGVKRVHRHLINGDILLLNRQPTLHKPSIMAHKARILKNEKTVRLHYANCKAYNADFDGDEMNVHFPQNELARSEGYNIVNVSKQYLVPKDGTPLSGLIQDHMISGVRLTIRGRFFNQLDYHNLIYQALSSYKIGKIQLLKPTIIKPQYLWSGKQILSTIIINLIPDGKKLINLKSTAKINDKAWENGVPRPWKAGGTPFKKSQTMSEAEVIIRNGELLCGVLDKTHYGATPYGLVHCIYELYGASCATKLLSALTKVFMRFLQQEGFTLGVYDILVIDEADKKRQKLVKKSRKIGIDVITQALNLPKSTPVDQIVETIEQQQQINPKLRTIIDRQYKTNLDSYTNKINQACLPAGLLCKFPQNNLQLMVQSGAKGSTVNTMQISCLLGQIELEGKRPPLMISGKSLPSFPLYEFQPRAGGFIDGRFMTGIQPQEFFFHCMAGREGLIDTAVKTSRSGYLQRCLIKHLEGLCVNYDMTVRDSDGSVIQFLYGEDGMDISKVQFLNEKQMDFLVENCRALIDKDVLNTLKNTKEDDKKLKEHQDRISSWRRIFGDPLKKQHKSPFTLFTEMVKRKSQNKKLTKEQIITIWQHADEDLKMEFRRKCDICPLPLNSIYQSDHYFGSLNERIKQLLDNYLQKHSLNHKQSKQIENMIKIKTIESLCNPGESVGLLAAQSIGEPSTQMTLNTFHFAGRGEMNVTLGIPRLREILMLASKQIKTPSMEIPFLKNLENLEHKSQELRRKLTRCVVENVLEKIDVCNELIIEPMRKNRYSLKFWFLPYKYYKDDYFITPKMVLKHISKKFIGEMFIVIRKYTKKSSNLIVIGDEKQKQSRKNNDDDDDNGDNVGENDGNNHDNDENSSDEEPEDDEDAKATNKFKQIHDDQEPEDDEDADLDDPVSQLVDENDRNGNDNDHHNNNDDDDNGGNDEIDNRSDRIKNKVIGNYSFVENYVYDKKRYLWCELTFALPLSMKKLDMTAILKEVASKSVIWETPNIKRAITYMRNDQLMLRTDGINILEMFKYYDILDLNRLYSNDIHQMANTYGIEAAMKVIVKEIQDVFNVYGITVDPRHLLLIADYMTYGGEFKPLSRKGMENSASPLQQMSFESSLVFMKQATVHGKCDNLRNPSSCLIVGKPCTTGTGSFHLLEKIPLTTTTTK